MACFFLALHILKVYSLRKQKKCAELKVLGYELVGDIKVWRSEYKRAADFV